MHSDQKHSYLDDNCNEHKKVKGSLKCVIKQKAMFQNLFVWFNNKTVYRSQQRFKSYNHDVYTEEVNKIALSSNGDKKTTNIWWDYNIHMEQMFLKYVKMKFWWSKNYSLKNYNKIVLQQ